MPLASKAKGPLGSSQRSESCASSDCSCVNNAMPDAPTQLDTASTTLIKSKLSTILSDYKQINTYLTEIRALDKIVDALDRITCLAQHAKGIKSVIQKLQLAIAQAQSTSTALANTQCISYSVAAQKGLAQPPLPSPSLLSKLVLTRYKCEIIVVCGKETNPQKIRLYKEIIEQVNKKDITSEAVAVRRLPSKDMVLAMDSKQACTSQLANQSQLTTFKEGARVKKREFAVVAHRI